MNTYKTFVSSTLQSAVENQLTIRLLEKLTHFGLALALGNTVAGVFKRRYVRVAFAHYQLLTSLWILDSLESAEVIINPTTGKPNID